MRRARTRWLLVASIALAGCASSGPDPRASRAEASAPTQSLAASGVASTPPPSSSAPSPGEPSLAVRPGDFDFTKNPGLVARIAETPHHYYRFINPRFAALVCRRYADWLSTDARVGLHGDAHVEQFGVTDLGRGLTDLDDTALGPRLVDLLRMGTSLALVVRQKAPDDARFAGLEADMIAELLRGYAEGVRAPDTEPPKTPLDERLEKKFVDDRVPFLDDADKSMLPFSSSADEAEAKKLHAAYEEQMLRFHMYGPKNKAFPAQSFHLKKMGPIAAGIGSALDRRILMRLEGRTSAPDDDLIVELKNERSPEDPSCLTASRDYHASRFLMGKARTRPFEPIEIERTGFWAGEWDVNHKIVKVDKTIESPADLSGVAFESGFVLGRGHLRSRVDGPARPSVLGTDEEGKPLPPSREGLEKDARRKLVVDDTTRARIVETSKALATEVVAGWSRFREPAPGK